MRVEIFNRQMWSLDTKIETEEEFQTLDHYDLSHRRVI